MTRSPVRSTARAVLPLAVLGCVLWWAAGSPGRTLRVLVVSLQGGPTLPFDELLTDVVGLVAWLCLCWFCLVVVLHAVALGSSGAARLCERSARLVAPRFMLTSARWLLGVALLAGPLTSGVATAAQVGGGSAPPSAAAVANLDRPTLPDLDRPVAPHTAPTFGDAVPSAAAAGAPTRPPATPSTPSTPMPSMPSMPSVRATQPSTTSGPVVTSNPHRETANAVGAYVVRRGDTLWDIAARHLGEHASAADIARAWPRWYATNQAAIGPNPQLIHPGLVLRAPPE